MPATFVAFQSANHPPVANAGGPYSVNEGSSVGLNGSGSDPDVGDTLTYSWDLDNNGTFETPGQNVTFGAATINGPATRTVTLRVTDNHGAIATSSATVNILNVAPAITSVGNTGPVNEGSPVTVIIAASDPGLNESLTYYFDFNNDGIFEVIQSSLSASFTYADNGSYIVRVQVTDQDGGQSPIATTTVIVNNVPPSITSVTNTGPVNEGSPVTVAVAATDQGINDTLTYYFDFNNDGIFEVVQSSPSVSYTYFDNGSYMVQVQVRDKDGAASSIATTTVTVNNVPPTLVSVVNNGSVNEGSPVTVTASATDPGSDTLTYLFDFNNDGIFEVSQPTPAATHTFSDNGSFVVRVQVSDDDGAGSNILTTTVVVNNVPPSISSVTNSGPVNEGSPVTVNVTAVDPGVNDTLTYYFDFNNDGIFEVIQSAASASFTYSDNGSYTVKVQVRDKDGGASPIATTTVIVNNVPPTVTALTATPNPVNEGTSVSFSGAFTDPGTDTHTILWNFGDGVTATGTLTPTHTYADNGTYTVTLTVTDDDGGTGSSSLQVTVNNVPPAVTSLTAAPNPANEGQEVAFTGAFTDPGTADTHTVLWNFGDGSTATGLTPSHTYADNGTYSVTLTVTDDDGGVGTKTETVTVNNVAPTVTPRPSLTTDEGTLVDLTGTTFSDPGFGDTHTATVNWGDGTTQAASLVVTNPGGPGSPRQGNVVGSHVYADNGIYSVEVCVTDDNGGMGCGSFTATVKNVPPTISTLGSTTVDEGSPMTVTVSGSDAGAADVVTLSATGLPPGTTFSQTPGNPATGTLAWTPAYTQAGSYSGIIVTATDDDGASTTHALTLTVNEKGQPVIAVTNSNDRTVSIIDAQTNQEMDPEGVGKKPVANTFFDIVSGAVVSPVTLYVAQRDTSKEISSQDNEDDSPDEGKGSVQVLIGPAGSSLANPYDFSLGPTIYVGNRPEGLALRPNADEIWVTNRNDDSISIINRATETVVSIPLKTTSLSTGKGKPKETEIGRRPAALTFSPDGLFAYVIGRNSNNLIVIDSTKAATDTSSAILKSIYVGNKPVAIVVSPDGKRLYIANRSGNTITVVDVKVPSAPVVVAEIPTGAKPEGITLLPDGGKLYATSSETDSVWVFQVDPEMPYLTPLTAVSVGWEPVGIVVTKPESFAGRDYVYVANRGNNTVSMIDPTNYGVITIEVGKGPSGMAAGVIPTAP